MEILDDDGGTKVLFGSRGSSGCVTTCNVGWSIVQPISPPSEQGDGYGGGLGEDDGSLRRS